MADQRDCNSCGTIGCGHQDAMRCGVMLADWTPKLVKEKPLTRKDVQEMIREALRSYDKSWG